MNVILVYNEIPDNVSVYKLEQVSVQDIQRLKNCHGHLLNVEEDENIRVDLEWLFDDFLEREQVKNSLTTDPILVTAETLVIVTGMTV